MCMFMCTHMTSKNISITEEVYKKLLKLKGENESFSELLLRLINIQKKSFEKSFGAWKLSDDEKKDIWNDLTTHQGRRWNKSNIEDL